MAFAPKIANDTANPYAAYPVPRAYAWLVFAMVFGLMLSDYLSRQVINAIFPFLKLEWTLSDAQLGLLVSVVAITVGVASIPVSVLADRFGRVRSAAAMALVWSLATIACGLADSFISLLIARALVGLGEAGYGGVGAAILTRVFPARLHATVMSMFFSAAMIGSVLGVVLGAFIAERFGWHMAFLGMGAFGLVLALSFPLVVKEPAADPESVPADKVPVGKMLGQLLRIRTLLFVALGGASMMFAQTAFIAWLPSYLNRFYDLPPSQASVATAGLIISISVGMIAGGALVDRCSRTNPLRRLYFMMAFGVLSGCALVMAFQLPPGTLQIALLLLGLLVSTSFLGTGMAVVADATSQASHATAFAIIALGYMLLGGGPGPLLTGWLADAMGLDQALSLVSAAGLLGAGFFYLASRHYMQDRALANAA
jgi:MFS family permease